MSRVSPPRSVRASAESMLRIEFERFFRAALLNEAEQRVENDDSEDDRGVQPEAQHQLDEAGRQQDIDEDVVELGEEPHQRSLLLAQRQAVRPIGPEPRRRLRGVKAVLGIDSQTLLDFLRRHRVPGRRVRSRNRRRRCTHGGSFLVRMRSVSRSRRLGGTPRLPGLIAPAEKMRRRAPCMIGDPVEASSRLDPRESLRRRQSSRRDGGEDLGPVLAQHRVERLRRPSTSASAALASATPAIRSARRAR